MKSVSIHYKDAQHTMSWYDGSTAEDLEQVGNSAQQFALPIPERRYLYSLLALEQHLRKKFGMAPAGGDLFLLDPANDEEVVISNALPDGGEFKLKVVQNKSDVTVGQKENFKRIDHHSDVRVTKISPLMPPALLLEELPTNASVIAHVRASRRIASAIVNGHDDRLLVIVGPCSIHDPEAAKEYATRLRKLAAELSDDLFIIMRVYFEKPRTTVGWKGLINDPYMDNSFKINKGLRQARDILLDINKMGVPCGCEFLDTISPQYMADLVSWGAIGARTTESQLHRELTSGMSMPIGFKNSTAGDIGVASDAVVSARHTHCFLSVTTQGLIAIVNTKGNPDCHVILRGGSSGPNYEAHHVAPIQEKLVKMNPVIKIMIDCSHGNSRKIHTNQPIVCEDIGKQIASGNKEIMGVMIESHLVAGAQKLSTGKPLTYGQSITDACINWDTTVGVLKKLAEDVAARRHQS
jgi:3-deoxy-7-phosphoheptulonate synthase